MPSPVRSIPICDSPSIPLVDHGIAPKSETDATTAEVDLAKDTLARVLTYACRSSSSMAAAAESLHPHHSGAGITVKDYGWRRICPRSPEDASILE
jgi:hypothetical protein